MSSPSVSQILLFNHIKPNFSHVMVLWWPLPFKLGKKPKRIFVVLSTWEETAMIKLLFHTQRFSLLCCGHNYREEGQVHFVYFHSQWIQFIAFFFYELFKALDRLVELEQFSGCCYPHLRSRYLIGSDNLYLTKFIRCKNIFSSLSLRAVDISTSGYYLIWFI